MNALHASFSHYLELYITHIARFISPTLMLLPLKTHNTVSKRKKNKEKSHFCHFLDFPLHQATTALYMAAHADVTSSPIVSGQQ